MLDAFPHHLPHLGFRLRLVLQRPDDLARIIRERRLRALRTVTIYSVEKLDGYEENKVDIVRAACVEVNVTLRMLRYEDLWDVPLVYN
ncbi:hypothetical protein EXIGLDRAFT_727885 [Exidia glandulosa HHB12029]|uniref:Uncharacterized protein n=1 Tax=Exidia glandulosa HHB12029 TaxID=1314781 RepID=A0A165LYP1_EXIGL|nr:hypothetical protein EXIGLDRAFT_727885 [Exidia glandulosa HHB12029]